MNYKNKRFYLKRKPDLENPNPNHNPSTIFSTPRGGTSVFQWWMLYDQSTCPKNTKTFQAWKIWKQRQKRWVIQ